MHSPVTSPMKVIHQQDLNCFHSKSKSQSRLKWHWIIHLFQDCLKLHGHHSLKHLAQKWSAGHWTVVVQLTLSPDAFFRTDCMIASFKMFRIISTHTEVFTTSQAHSTSPALNQQPPGQVSSPEMVGCLLLSSLSTPSGFINCKLSMKLGPEHSHATLRLSTKCRI